MRSTISNARVARFLGAAFYFGALIFVVLLLGGGWGALILFLMSVTAGVVSGRWSVALAALVVPVAALTFSDEDYGGDSVSGRFDAALFAAYFGVLPVAVAIAIGVGVRRVVSRRRGRVVASSI